MRIIDETGARTTTTPAGTMSALAGPSRGSHELSTWRVRMEPGSASPEHVVDRDQVWMPVSGRFRVSVDGEDSGMAPGQAAVIPAGAVRQVRTGDGPGEALVCMVPGGRASVAEREGSVPLPWAE
ncbi:MULTISPECIES: cupin domain-containing protein [Nocardiopsis]|uniref:Cupin n=1 Tax=Nocardiopsis sinuspersici TaxID=501010 RepID=A0A1V3C1W5_9ACTN|nr:MULTISPECIES: cupin domain-containing protein [Nocardiopsis]NYH50643.1 quercetin dioxygenase-like cupin family protein [Nocardiopsis sinuspersici]OOC54506.1 cupin [Nocardiopsis sinuspersici]